LFARPSDRPGQTITGFLISLQFFHSQEKLFLNFCGLPGGLPEKRSIGWFWAPEWIAARRGNHG
jgi:hypothetical protein